MELATRKSSAFPVSHTPPSSNSSPDSSRGTSPTASEWVKAWEKRELNGKWYTDRIVQDNPLASGPECHCRFLKGLKDVRRSLRERADSALVGSKRKRDAVSDLQVFDSTFCTLANAASFEKAYEASSREQGSTLASDGKVPRREGKENPRKATPPLIISVDQENAPPRESQTTFPKMTPPNSRSATNNKRNSSKADSRWRNAVATGSVEVIAIDVDDEEVRPVDTVVIIDSEDEPEDRRGGEPKRNENVVLVDEVLKNLDTRKSISTAKDVRNREHGPKMPAEKEGKVGLRPRNVQVLEIPSDSDDEEEDGRKKHASGLPVPSRRMTMTTQDTPPPQPEIEIITRGFPASLRDTKRITCIRRLEQALRYFCEVRLHRTRSALEGLDFGKLLHEVRRALSYNGCDVSQRLMLMSALENARIARNSSEHNRWAEPHVFLSDLTKALMCCRTLCSDEHLSPMTGRRIEREFVLLLKYMKRGADKRAVGNAASLFKKFTYNTVEDSDHHELKHLPVAEGLTMYNFLYQEAAKCSLALHRFLNLGDLSNAKGTGYSLESMCEMLLRRAGLSRDRITDNSRAGLSRLGLALNVQRWLAEMRLWQRGKKVDAAEAISAFFAFCEMSAETGGYQSLSREGYLMLDTMILAYMKDFPVPSWKDSF